MSDDYRVLRDKTKHKITIIADLLNAMIIMERRFYRHSDISLVHH